MACRVPIHRARGCKCLWIPEKVLYRHEFCRAPTPLAFGIRWIQIGVLKVIAARRAVFNDTIYQGPSLAVQMPLSICYREIGILIREPPGFALLHELVEHGVSLQVSLAFEGLHDMVLTLLSSLAFRVSASTPSFITAS